MKHNHEGPHKYIKKRIGSKESPYVVWKCMIPGCTHYIKFELGENRHTICWRCGGVVVLTKLVMELTRPHCNKCTKGKKKEDKVVEELLAVNSIKMLSEMFGGKE